MNLDRRSLLKLFGSGAVIAPVVSGMPQMETQVVIVAPPQVELAPPPRLVPVSVMPDAPDGYERDGVFSRRIADGTVTTEQVKAGRL